MPIAPRSRTPWAVAGILGVVAALAWALPDRKPAAVLGRLDYEQFVFAAAATLIALSAVLIAAAPRRRATAFRLAAVWLGVAMPLLVAEAVAWLRPPRHEMDNPWYLGAGGMHATADLPFERPARLHWEGFSRGDLTTETDDDPYARPVVFQTDFEGFRNSQDIHTADLVFLGDSFTEAGNMPEEETFVLLTAAAQKATARNLGRAGYAPPMELVVLTKYGLRCRPKVVIWQVAEANDLDESVAFHRWLANGKPAVFDTAGHLPNRTDSWAHRSPTWQLFRALRHRQPWSPAGTFRDRDGRVHEVRFRELPDRRVSPVNHPGWPLLAEALRNGYAMLHNVGIRLIVLLIPMKARGLGPSVELAGTDAGRLAPNRDLPESATLASHLGDLCRELRVPFVDATPALRRQAAAGELVYLPFDTHLSAAGHRVVAEELATALHAD